MSINILAGVSREIRNFERTRICREQGLAFDQSKPLRLLDCQRTLLECGLGRSQALMSRLQNEINLVCYIVEWQEMGLEDGN